MIAAVLALLAGALVGFVGSRAARRPERGPVAAPAAVAPRPSGSRGSRRGRAAPDLQRACFSAMARHARRGDDGITRLPARYLLQLHPDDLTTVDESRGWFTDGLADALRDEASSQGWAIDGDIDIRYEASSAAKPGVPVALAVEPTQPSRARQGPRRTTVALRRSDTGDSVELGEGPLVVGRGSDAGLRIDDKRVSRRHAEIAPEDAGWSVTDLGSANGTTRNGRALEPGSPVPLRVGDTIGIGPVELTVISAGGRTR